MRISTSTILRNYNANLTKSMSNLEAARTRVSTMRNFSKASENPAAATKAFQLRRDFIRNEDHIENIKVAQGRFTSIEAGIDEINQMMVTVDSENVLRALHGTNSIDERKAIAESFDKMRDSMLMSLNAKDGDRFVFGGTNTEYAPFKMSENDDLMYFIHEENGKPVYANVDTGLGEDGNPIKIGEDADGNAINFSVEKFKELANETLYLDTGFGLQLDDNKDVVTGTAMNMAYSALNVVGFGKDSDGNPNNVLSMLKELSKGIKEDPLNSTTRENVEKLTDKFVKARKNVVNQWTSVGTMTKFLDSTEDRLINSRINLNTKIVDIENVDMGQAISEFEFAKYAYNAALKVGMSILQPSFIDFMK